MDSHTKASRFYRAGGVTGDLEVVWHGSNRNETKQGMHAKLKWGSSLQVEWSQLGLLSEQREKQAFTGWPEGRVEAVLYTRAAGNLRGLKTSSTEHQQVCMRTEQNLT